MYVLNGIWPTDGPVPPKDDVIGCISAIVWSLTLLPLLKYVRSLFAFSPLRIKFSQCDQVIICLHFGTYEGLAPITIIPEPIANNLSGEGGTFALFQGIYPPKVFEKSPTHDSLMAGKKSRKDIRPPSSFRWPMLVWVSPFLGELLAIKLLNTSQALFGTSLTMADGVLTAAVSVTSAVGGIGESTRLVPRGY